MSTSTPQLTALFSAVDGLAKAEYNRGLLEGASRLAAIAAIVAESVTRRQLLDMVSREAATLAKMAQESATAWGEYGRR